MRWNWQQPDWPNFTWQTKRLCKAEERFFHGGGVFVGTMGHLQADDQLTVTIEALSTEALTTSEIEGEILDRASVQSSIRKQLGLAAENRSIPAAEQGVAEMMVHLYRTYANPLSDETLFGWHRMIMNGRHDLRAIGAYRSHPEPMQIVSGAAYSPNVHFEAPPSSMVPDEMARFINWFNATAPSGSAPLPPLTRAGIAHLYFESIHPFEDGNGRLGRAISELALAQALERPTLTALATIFLAKRRAYYDALEHHSRDNEITEFLCWFAAATLEAQQRTQALAEYLVEKTRLLDRVSGQLNERQLKALLRMLREGPAGFKGALSAGNYITITGATPATATRDLADMVAKGALRRTGEHRYARYHPNMTVKRLKSLRIDAAGAIIETNDMQSA